MIRVSVLYPHQNDANFDLPYYRGTHIPLVKERLGSRLVRAEIDKAIAGGDPKAPAPFFCIGHLYFNTLEDFQQGFAEHGREFLADIPNYTSVRPLIQISEVVGE